MVVDVGRSGLDSVADEYGARIRPNYKAMPKPRARAIARARARARARVLGSRELGYMLGAGQPSLDSFPNYCCRLPDRVKPP